MLKIAPLLTKSRFVWTRSGVFILTLHLAALFGLPWYFAVSHPATSMYILTGLIAYVSVIGLTTVYHRLYAHHAYHLAKPVEAIFLFLATLTLQGSALRWSFDHRSHHRHIDGDGDPYNATRGFLYAHVLWIFEVQPPIDNKTVKDLQANRLVSFQHQHYLPLAILCNVLVSVVIGWILDDFLAAFVLVLGLRLILSYHLTWSINSLAHFVGSKSYSKELTARDNWLLSFFVPGEGNHNTHHTFASDYRNGFYWYHFDPGKWIIWTLSKCRLAWDLERTPKSLMQRTAVRKDTELLLEQIRQGVADFRTKLEARFGPLPNVESFILERSHSLRARIKELERLQEEKQALRARRPSRSEYRDFHKHLRTRQRSFKTEWAEWCRLCGFILQT